MTEKIEKPRISGKDATQVAMACITVEMNEVEISALVTKGYLAGEARNEPKAIKAAVEALISDLVLS